jgi:hypothetical protein
MRSLVTKDGFYELWDEGVTMSSAIEADQEARIWSICCSRCSQQLSRGEELVAKLFWETQNRTKIHEGCCGPREDES